MLKSVDFYDDAHTKLTDLLEQFALAENLLNKADRKVFDGKWRFAGRYEQAMSSGENKDFASNIKECVKKIKDLGVSLVDEDQKSGGKASFLFGSNFKKFVSNLDSSIAFTSYNGDFPVIAEPMEYDRSKGTVLKEKRRAPGGLPKSPSPKDSPKSLDSSDLFATPGSYGFEVEPTHVESSRPEPSESSKLPGESWKQFRDRRRSERSSRGGVAVVGDSYLDRYWRYLDSVEENEGKEVAEEASKILKEIEAKKESPLTSDDVKMATTRAKLNVQGRKPAPSGEFGVTPYEGIMGTIAPREKSDKPAPASLISPTISPLGPSRTDRLRD
jgi:hypothetical protein